MSELTHVSCHLNISRPIVVLASAVMEEPKVLLQITRQLTGFHDRTAEVVTKQYNNFNQSHSQDSPWGGWFVFNLMSEGVAYAWRLHSITYQAIEC